MIPTANLDIMEIPDSAQPEKTYWMHDGHIRGFCEGLEAAVQAIYKILNTERYEHVIYSWNYGFQKNDLIGQPVDYVCAELEDRITEALTQHDMITGCDDFEFETGRGWVHVTFRVTTVYGVTEAETEVQI